MPLRRGVVPKGWAKVGVFSFISDTERPHLCLSPAEKPAAGVPDRLDSMVGRRTTDLGKIISVEKFFSGPKVFPKSAEVPPRYADVWPNAPKGM